MDELTIGDKIYISSKRAAAITGYAKDYVGQLCREGRVEATLVGRSWYVLESSIRAHRFGSEASVSEVAEPEAKVQKETLKTWEAPTYRSEPVSEMPIMARRSVNLLDNVVPEATPEAGVVEPSIGPETVEDMQSAWREWFASRQEASAGTREEENAMEGFDKREVATEIVEDSYDNEEEEVALNRVAEPEVEEVEQVEEIYDPVPSTPEIEEAVSLRRSYSIDIQPTPTVHRVPSEPKRTETTAPEIRWSQSVSKDGKRARKGKGGLAMKTALVCVSIFALLIAAIGSGAADSYIRKAGFEYSLLRFIAGASILDK